MEALINLIISKYSTLSDEHLVWDEWALKWQEHSRTKPDLDYTKSIWMTCKGYTDAITRMALEDAENNFLQPRLNRALRREEVANLTILILNEPDKDFSREIKNLS